MSGDIKLNRRLGGSITILGGLLIVSSGFIERGLTYRIINYVSQNTSYLTTSTKMLVEIILSVLSLIIGLGGFAVMIGGLLILEQHVLLGRVFVGLGGSAGVFGFIITFGYSLVTSGFSSILTHVFYWVGILLAIIGVWIARHS